MITAIYNFLTAHDIRSERIADALFQSMERHIPISIPDVYGEVEPLDHPFSGDRDHLYAAWKNGIFWSNKACGSFGRIFHGTKKRHSTIKHYFETSTEATESCVRFLPAVSDLLKVDFSCLHFFGDRSPTPEDEFLQGLTSHALREFLPTVPFACCFGQPYLELMGRSTLKSVPFVDCQDIGDEMLFCQAYHSVGDCVDLSESFKNQRERVKEAIGRQYFFDPHATKQTAIAPSFIFQRE
jgi:hypothetical protein